MDHSAVRSIIESVIIDGDRAAVHHQLTFAFRPTGEEVTTEVLDLFAIANGKVASFVEFADTALAAAMVSRLKPSVG